MVQTCTPVSESLVGFAIVSCPFTKAESKANKQKQKEDKLIKSNVMHIVDQLYILFRCVAI